MLRIYSFDLSFSVLLVPVILIDSFLKKCVLEIVVHSLFQARLFDEPQLASLCLENIDKNTGDALAAEGFTDIDLGNAVL